MLAKPIRYGTYPLIMGAAFTIAFLVLEGLLPAWPTLPIMVVIGITIVAALEKAMPYETAWTQNHGDIRADALHAVANFGLLAAAAWLLHSLREYLPTAIVWPLAWPGWAQCLLAGAIIDLGLYFMHRASHQWGWAWRLHAIHHGAERLYWLNGERRHPLSALLMAGPGLVLVAGLGAPPAAISTWLAILAVHLALQHSNIDYTVGPARKWLGVAETHRWHHKREYEDAQVNFGEFWLIWDRCFGTFLDPVGRIRTGEVGLRDESMPVGYLAQLGWPFPSKAPDFGRRAVAFESALAMGYESLRRGRFEEAYTAFERAHVLGQPSTISHVRSHLAFLRWAMRTGDRRELAGQLFRLCGASLATWLWIPRGNTGGARVDAFRTMPIPADLVSLLNEEP